MEMTAPGVTSQAEMSGAEITMRCLQEEGVEFVFGYPGGAILPIYDEMFKQDKVKHILVRHEQAAVHGADGYARSTGEGGRGDGDLRSGTDQCGHRDRYRLHGFHPAGDHQRPGSDSRHRPGCLPGGRHRRHHAPVREAQLPGQGRQGPRDHHQEGLLHRQDRAPGTGAGGHPQGRAAGQDPVPLPGADQPALLQPGGAEATPARSRRPSSFCCRPSAR